MAGCGDDGGNADPTGTGSSSGSGGSGANGPEDPITPAAGGIRRLLRTQYMGSLRVLFGEVAAPAAAPPAALPLAGFDATGAPEITTALLRGAHEQSASEVAAAVVAEPGTRSKDFPMRAADAERRHMTVIAAGTLGPRRLAPTLTGTEIAPWWGRRRWRQRVRHRRRRAESLGLRAHSRRNSHIVSSAARHRRGQGGRC